MWPPKLLLKTGRRSRNQQMEALPSQSAMLAAYGGSPSAVWKVADLIPSFVTLATGPVVWRKPAASSEAGDTYISYITG